jgi:hypothetical protein
VKTVPLLLASGVIAAAALAPFAEKTEPGTDFAKRFVECSDRLGPAACENYLDEWAKHPNARHEIVQRFATDKAFALHLIALTDAKITTGSVKR